MGSGIISIEIFSLTNKTFFTKIKHKAVLALIDIALNAVNEASITFILNLNWLILGFEDTFHPVIYFVSALLFTQLLRSFRKKALLTQIIITTLLTGKTDPNDRPLFTALTIFLAVYRKAVSIEGDFYYFHVMRNIMKFFLCLNILI